MRPLIAVLAGAAATANAASPLLAWSNTEALKSITAHGEGDNLMLEVVKAAPQRTVVFVMDEVVGAHSLEPAMAGLGPVVKQFAGAASTVKAAAVYMSDDVSSLVSRSASLAGCASYTVTEEEGDATGPATLSRAGLVTALAAKPQEDACVVYTVPVSRASITHEASYMLRVANAAAAHPFVAVVTGEQAGHGGRGLAGAVAAAAAIPVGVRAVPETVVGLGIGFAFLFVVGVGLTCVSGIKTPDVMHSFELPAGKEY